MRIVTTLARWIRRPVFDFWVAEEDRRLVGTTLVTYAARAGWISSVAVHPEYRRRGYARSLVEQAHASIRHGRRGYALLEVLADNGAARALYEGMGYRPLRSSTVLVREPGPLTVPPRATEGLRPFRKTDAPTLAQVADGHLTQRERERQPASREQFVLPPLIAQSTDSLADAWVIDRRNGPMAFVRATVGGITRTANLTQPIVSHELAPEDAYALVASAVEWVESVRPLRMVTELPDGRELAAGALARAGFQPAYRIDALACDLAP